MKIFASLLLCLGSSATAWGQLQFELVEPTGVVSATAELQRGRLLVYGQGGQRLYFSREVQYDTTDRRYAGYYSVDTHRALRFPRSGTGPMQTASMLDPHPRFRESRRIVRPIIPVGGLVPRPVPPIAVAPIVPTPIFPGPVLPGPILPVPGLPRYSDPYGPAYPIAPLSQSVLIDSRLVANPPLAPARVALRNDGPREVQVGLVDLQNPSGNRSMRIRPGASAEVELRRDAGGQRISHYRVVTPYGTSITREFVAVVAPATRYEIVVHEWAMQSVAIDRTGKSPNVIEDVNFQGRGIGRFLLPAGPELQPGVINVYSAAIQQRNAGSVQPIVPQEDLPVRDGNIRKLENAVLEAQRAAQSRARGN